MNSAPQEIFLNFGFFIVLLFITGLYCILVTRTLIRTLIGVELLMKAATLLIIAAGYAAGRTALAQTLVITLIIIEVVVIAIMAGVVLSIYRHNYSLEMTRLKDLKG